MALPSTNQAWPPAQLSRTLPQMGVWSAWFAGDSDMLAGVYGSANGSNQEFFASDHGGFKATVGRAIQRWFWGERSPERRVKLHIPIAAELCQASADLLFADSITLKVHDKTTQDRLDVLCDDDLHTELAESAELAAALGGVYVKIAWDTSVNPDAPFITHVDADQAIPEFAYGRLRAVTFWQVVARDGKRVYRHLERHETDANGVGIILHGLYEGEENKLGTPRPLTEQPATAPLAELVDAFGSISSESENLCVVYVPNQTPNRTWRTDPNGRNLGRSDLDGIEPLMDALDETYTSWQRDIRLGKSRIMIAKSLLENAGPGRGQTFNADQEAYSSVNMLGGEQPKITDLITEVQFKIRVEEHRATASDLVLNILRMAGYSAETFGLYEGGGTVQTATEVEAKQQRSLLTRDRKIRIWRPAIARIIEKLLAVDQAIFNTPVTVQAPEVLFPDGVQESQLSIAQTAQALRNADAASDETLVGMVHPDWEDSQVQIEVGKIVAQRKAAQPPALPDPMFMHPGGPGGVDDGSSGAGDPTGNG
ncbi:phage portal protein [Paenarthrobacter nicotinovorans]|uniref:phage portal protein n=1 Tax=Paenarthrobacter nicotinovorans TaxID=29320 RepID=UPI0037F368DF